MKKLFFSVFALSALMLSACSGSSENPSSAPSSEESSQAQSSSAQSSSAGQSSSAASSSSASSSSAAPAEVVTISGGATTVDIGAYVTFTATGPAGVAITWASDDTTVATVEDGVVTGVAAGTAKITATAGTASDYVYIEVTEPVPPTVRQLVISTDPTYATAKHTVEFEANGQNEVKAIQVDLKADEYFYIDLGEGEDNVRYRHYDDLKSGDTDATTNLEAYGTSQDFKVLTAGLYNFYIELTKTYEDENFNKTVWIEKCDPAPVYTKYQIKVNGTAYELKSGDKGWYKEQYTLKDGKINVEEGQSITFEGYSEEAWHDITASVTKNGDDETNHIYNNVKKVAGAYQIRRTTPDDEHKAEVYFQVDLKNKFGFWVSEGGEMPVLTDGYYIAGSFNDWKADAEWVLGADSEPGQFYIKKELHQGDEFKVIKKEGDTTIWYQNAGEESSTTQNITYKDATGSAIADGFLTVASGGNFEVVVPGEYFIQIASDGIWTAMEKDTSDHYKLDAMEAKFDDEDYDAIPYESFEKGLAGWQYAVESVALLADHTIALRWKSGTPLQIALGENAVPYFDLSTDKTTITTKTNVAPINIYFTIFKSNVTVYVSVPASYDEVTMSLHDSFTTQFAAGETYSGTYFIHSWNSSDSHTDFFTAAELLSDNKVEIIEDATGYKFGVMKKDCTESTGLGTGWANVAVESSNCTNIPTTSLELRYTSSAISVWVDGVDPSTIVTTYHVVGTINGATKWNFDQGLTLVENPGQEGEYMLESAQPFAANDEIKVLSSDSTWFPPSGGNWVINEEGTYQIYFRPAGHTADGWNGYFTVVAA